MRETSSPKTLAMARLHYATELMKAYGHFMSLCLCLALGLNGWQVALATFQYFLLLSTVLVAALLWLLSLPPLLTVMRHGPTQAVLKRGMQG